MILTVCWKTLTLFEQMAQICSGYTALSLWRNMIIMMLMKIIMTMMVMMVIQRYTALCSLMNMKIIIMMTKPNIQL